MNKKRILEWLDKQFNPKYIGPQMRGFIRFELFVLMIISLVGLLIFIIQDLIARGQFNTQEFWTFLILLVVVEVVLGFFWRWLGNRDTKELLETFREEQAEDRKLFAKEFARILREELDRRESIDSPK